MHVDVVFIVVDALRYDVTKKLLTKKVIKYRLKQLHDGISKLFVSCLSGGPCTWTSVPVLLTGLPPHLPDYPAMSRRPSLALFLRRAGYKTSAYIANPIIGAHGYLNHFEKISREYKSSLKLENKIGRDTGVHLTDLLSRSLIALYRKIAYSLGVPGNSWNDTARILTSAYEDWKRTKSYNSKTFTYIHLMDLHFPAPYRLTTCISCAILRQHPFHVSKEYKGFLKIKEDYEKCAYSTLTNIISFIEAITKKSKEFIIIVTSDHGELLGEYGLFGHDGIPLRIKKVGLFYPIFVPELIQVPLLVITNIEDYIRLLQESMKKLGMWSHYALVWSLLKMLTDDDNIIKTYYSIINLLNFHPCEADRIVLWGIGFRGVKYAFIKRENGTVRIVTPNYNRKLYTYYTKRWQLLKKIMWLKTTLYRKLLE